MRKDRTAKRGSSQARLHRRAMRAAVLGPARFVVRRTPCDGGASELLECGHTVAVKPILGSRTALRALYRRCRECGTGAPPLTSMRTAAPRDPCGTCGCRVTHPGARRCNGCWEVERRLEDYAAFPGGRRELARILEEHDRDPRPLASPVERPAAAVRIERLWSAITAALRGRS